MRTHWFSLLSLVMVLALLLPGGVWPTTAQSQPVALSDQTPPADAAMLAPQTDGTWINYTNGNYVYALAVEGDYVWAGTSGGVVRWNRTDGSYVKYTTADGLANNDVNAIAVDGADHLWFGTYGGGVSEYDGSTWTTYTAADGLADNWVRAIAMDKVEHLWFGTHGGVSEFIPAGDGPFFVAINRDDEMYAFPISDMPQAGHLIGSGSVAAVADFDNDGFCEVIAARSADRFLRLYESDGGTGFIEQVVSGDAYPSENFVLSSPIFPLTDSAVADFDNNGLLDFAFTGRRCSSNYCGSSGEGSIQLHLNLGNGEFERRSIDVSDFLNRNLEGMLGLDDGDFDTDGFNDLAAQHYWNEPTDNMTHVLLGNGDGSFTDNVAFTNPNPGSGEGGTPSLVSGDFNSDGHLDLIVGQDDDGDPGQTWLYLGDGTGDFTYFGPALDTNPTDESGANRPGSGLADAYDFDSDGNLDIVAGAHSIGLLLFKGNGDGSFQEPILLNSGTGWQRIAVPPDSQPPCSGGADDTIPPAAITDLAASTGSKPGEIDLTWTAPGDDGNTGTAMTYTVRYADSPIAPGFGWLLATDVSGEPTPLAAGTLQSMTVSGLVPGQTYYLAIKTQDEVPNTSGLSNSPSAMAGEEPLWTLMFYMDGDNNLDSNYVAAFNQLESAADNSNVNVLVAWDRFANGDGDSAYYEVQHDMDLAETNPAADYTDDVNRWPQNELRMNESATLSGFIQWARTNYPAQHYALIISNHGTGLGGLATDAGSGGDWLTVTEWSTALATATSDGTDKIDVVFADACLMAMIEDAFQIRDYTDYYVASENLSWIPGRSTSGPYDDYISSIGETTSPRDFAVALVDRYRNWLDADHPSVGYTISAVDLAALSGVVSATNALASELNSQMSTYAGQISEARVDTQKFDSNNSRTLTQADVYVDLHDFASEIRARISDATIQDAADGVMGAVQSYVIAEEHRDGVLRLGESVQTLDGSRGVSIFFPPNASSFYNSTNYDFAVGATWPGSQISLIRTQAGEVEWGPMLVTYFNETQPGGPDTSEPPSLVSPLAPEYNIYLPLVLRNH